MLTDPAVELLATAFAADPLYRWLFDVRAIRHEALRANFALAVGGARRSGYLDRVAGGAAVALWTDPDRPLLDDPTPFLELLDRYAPHRREAALDAMARCSAHCPPGAAVLQVVGVDPRRAGRGLGTAVLRTRLGLLDRTGAVAFLESSNPRNDAFYRRLGFEAVAGVRVADDGPMVTAMVRPPGAREPVTARGRTARCS